MNLKGIIDEDFVNYKKPSMYIAFPHCSFKCEKECSECCCQNSTLATSPDIEITVDELCRRYLDNPISEAIVCGGMEPFDSYDDLIEFITSLRKEHDCNDDVVIYTGYTENECRKNNWLSKLFSLGNIIVKFGRYIPGQNPHHDEILGVKLASDNQYACRLNISHALDPDKRYKVLCNIENAERVRDILNELELNLRFKVIPVDTGLYNISDSIWFMEDGDNYVYQTTMR